MDRKERARRIRKHAQELRQTRDGLPTANGDVLYTDNRDDAAVESVLRMSEAASRLQHAKAAVLFTLIESDDDNEYVWEGSAVSVTAQDIPALSTLMRNIIACLLDGLALEVERGDYDVEGDQGE